MELEAEDDIAADSQVHSLLRNELGEELYGALGNYISVEVKEA